MHICACACVFACVHVRAIVRVQSRCYRRGVTIHLPEREPRAAPTLSSTRRGCTALHEDEARGESEERRSGIEGWETRGENASATARILTRVARGPNSVTMRAARGIPRNTRNTSSSQKTNEMTRPTHRRARVRLPHTNTHARTHTCTRVRVGASSSHPNSLIP